MSFSYWGADKVTVQKPIIKGRPPGVITTRRGGSSAYGRESSANAKFGNRLVSDGSSHPRPSSRRLVTPTSRRQPLSEEGPNYARATVTRPAWDTSTRSPFPPSKRSRNTSQASAATKNTVPTTPPTTAKAPVSSPAPSEDSGVGLYRQMLVNEPSFDNNL